MEYERRKPGKQVAGLPTENCFLATCVPVRRAVYLEALLAAIETSQRLSGAPWVDNYTAETLAPWPRSERKWHPGGRRGGLGPEVISTNRGELKQTRKLRALKTDGRTDRQEWNFEGMIWTHEEGNKRTSLTKTRATQAWCIYNEDPDESLQCV